MQLPGRLKMTTLGDVLGTLNRAQANGTLELVCETTGRTHRIFFARGYVIAVELDGATTPLAEILKRAGALDDATQRRAVLRAMSSGRLLGEVLVTDFHVSEDAIFAAVRKQLLSRLAELERLRDARLVFRVTMRPPREALRETPLEPREFLAGRVRARDRSPAPPSSRDMGALRLLGVSPAADATEIKRAFRKLARELHPDLHPTANADERQALAHRFAQVAAAYQSLVA